MHFYRTVLLLSSFVLLALSCGEENVAPAELSTFSVSLNGVGLSGDQTEVPVNSFLEIVFSGSVAAGAFEDAFSVSPAPVSVNFQYSNQSSRVRVDLGFDDGRAYTVALSTTEIGQNGERLDAGFSFQLTTTEGTGNSVTACTSASNNCLETLTLSDGGSLDYYTSFPLFDESVELEGLESAVIVVHGANRDADNYFGYLTSAVQAIDAVNKTVVIAPQFKNNSEANGDELYWTNTSWRLGNNSLAGGGVSSFSLVDEIVRQLADVSRFPNLTKVIITGHSSGGLFTHLYGAANQVDGQFPGITFEYVAANSQYFYYPDGQRINEVTNELFTPTDCSGYDLYPFGYNVVPDYVAETSEAVFNQQFSTRRITYLLGNGTQPDPTFNDASCGNQLLGSSRYQRGENMFLYMQLVFQQAQNHQRVIVDGIGHDGQGMYQSEAFRTFLQQLLS